jgi:hypothetical protein
MLNKDEVNMNKKKYIILCFVSFLLEMALLFRSTLIQSLAKTARPMWMSLASTTRRNMSSHNKETDEEFDQRWKAYFERPNIDGIKQKINIE